MLQPILKLQHPLPSPRATRSHLIIIQAKARRGGERIEPCLTDVEEFEPAVSQLISNRIQM